MVMGIGLVESVARKIPSNPATGERGFGGLSEGEARLEAPQLRFQSEADVDLSMSEKGAGASQPRRLT